MTTETPQITEGRFTRSCGCSGRYAGGTLVVGAAMRCRLTEYVDRRSPHAKPKITSVTITGVWDAAAGVYVPVTV